MHVGLNLVFLVPGETGGMEVYARELIPELVQAAPDVALHGVREPGSRRGSAGGRWGDLIPAVTVPVRARNRFEWVRGRAAAAATAWRPKPASTWSTASPTRRRPGADSAASSRFTTWPTALRRRHIWGPPA